MKQLNHSILTGIILVFIILLSSSVFAYSSTVTVSTTNLGQIRGDFYGYSSSALNTFSMYDNVSYDNDCTRESQADYTKSRQDFLNGGGKSLRILVYLSAISASEGSINNIDSTGHGIRLAYEKAKWAYENNVTLNVVLTQMPSWLGNTSSGLCTSYAYCGPTNYTKWQILVNQTVMNLTNNGLWVSAVQIEVLNEPALGTFLNNISNDNMTKTIYYNLLYNFTYDIIKAQFPNMKVIPGSVDRTQPNMANGIISNFSNPKKYDGLTMHVYPYSDAVLSTNSIEGQTSWLDGLCTTYNGDCSNIYITEWNIQSNTYTSALRNQNQTRILSEGYSYMLNSQKNYSSFVFKFDTYYKNSSCDSSTNYTSNDPINNITYQAYNITKLFATNHKAGNTVYNTSSSNSSLKVVTSKDSTKYYITLTNTLNENASTVIDTNVLPLTNYYLRDVETGEAYQITNNISTIKNIAGYGVKTLSSEDGNPISINPYSSNPANGSTVNSRYVNLGWNITSINPLSSIIFNWNNTNYSLYDDSLVLYYNFDNRSSLGENDTLVKDISKYGNNASVIGGSNVTWDANGKYSGNFNFSGGWALINTSFGFNNQMLNGWTESIWARKMTGVKCGGYLVAREYEYRIYQSSTNCLYSFDSRNVSSSDRVIGSSLNASDGLWHNLVYTYDASTNMSYGYIDGVLVGSVSQEGIKVTANRYFVIGGNQYIADNVGWNGSIDDFMIFNRTLSSNEISQLYNYQLTKYNSTYYSFNNNYSLKGTLNNNINLIINDTLSNSNISRLTIRALFNFNFKNTILKILQSSYGVNIHSFLSNCGYQVDVNNDGTIDTCTNTTWAREKYLDSKMNFVRRDTSFTYYYNVSNGDGTFNYSHNFNVETDLVDWAYQNGIKIVYVTGGVPNSMINTTSGWCNFTSSTTNSSCPPLSYELYGNMTADFLNKSHCGLYSNTCLIEVRNEPNLNNWLNNLSQSNPIKSREYNKMFNATYNKVKSIYPNISVGGGGVTFESSGAREIITPFIGNFSNITDFVSFHSYTNNNLYSVLKSNLNEVTGNITLNKGNVSRIIITEFNFHNGTVTNASDSTNWEYYKSQIASIYSLNKDNNFNITFLPYQWSEQYYYGQFYPEFPYFYNFVSEPQMENKIYPIYSVTSNYTRYAPAGGTVYNNSIDNSEIVGVSTVYLTACNLILTNTYNDQQNVSISFDTSLCGNNLIDTQTGNLISNGSTIILDNYGVKYLTEPIYSPREDGTTDITNYLGEVITNIRTPTEYQGEGACVAIIYQIEQYPVLIGLIGAVFLIGVVIVFVAGWMAFKPGQQVTAEGVGVFFLTLLGIGVLVIVGIVALESLCSTGIY